MISMHYPYYICVLLLRLRFFAHINKIKSVSWLFISLNENGLW